MKSTVDALDNLADEYQVVVNCAGLGARWICQDKSVLPLRGQVCNEPSFIFWKFDLSGLASIGALGEDCHVC